MNKSTEKAFREWLKKITARNESTALQGTEALRRAFAAGANWGRLK